MAGIAGLGLVRRRIGWAKRRPEVVRWRGPNAEVRGRYEAVSGLKKA